MNVRYCVHNAGHNHPEIIAALKDELDRSGPAMLQSHVPELAGELAERLCSRCGGGLKKVFFCTSGSEGVEAAIKFSRAHTRRTGLLYAEGAFHGIGMFSGIEFTAPSRMAMRIPFEAFRKIHAGMFGQVLVMRLFRDKDILTQICGNNFLVLKVAPPLVVSEEQIEYFVDAVREHLGSMRDDGDPIPVPSLVADMLEVA